MKLNLSLNILSCQLKNNFVLFEKGESREKKEWFEVKSLSRDLVVFGGKTQVIGSVELLKSDVDFTKFIGKTVIVSSTVTAWEFNGKVGLKVNIDTLLSED